MNDDQDAAEAGKASEARRVHLALEAERRQLIQGRREQMEGMRKVGYHHEMEGVNLKLRAV